MQFGGQHGGVPTFGMALPGYFQPEHGTGNPEMTWYAVPQLCFKSYIFGAFLVDLLHAFVI
jgi:hypothetical protein